MNKLALILLILSAQAFAEIHGGESRTGSDVFSSVGKPGAAESKPLKSCHVICGPNKERYMVHYFCSSKTGRIETGGKILATLPGCRMGSEIVCGDQKTGFTILYPSLHRARGQYQSDLLSPLPCKVEEE